MPQSSQTSDQFRRSLEGAAEVAISEHADSITSSVVAAIWNAIDDELGRQQEQIDRQRQTIDNSAEITARRDAEIAALRKRLAETENDERWHHAKWDEKRGCWNLDAAGGAQ